MIARSQAYRESLGTFLCLCLWLLPTGAAFAVGCSAPLAASSCVQALPPGAQFTWTAVADVAESWRADFEDWPSSLDRPLLAEGVGLSSLVCRGSLTALHTLQQDRIRLQI
ncbi:MAG: hypothetical protein AB7O62_09770 [Pirellulales bacterium]